MNGREMNPTLSVVIPVYNEEGNLEETIRRVVKAAEDCGVSFEIVFVNDGSHDATGEILSETVERNACIRVVSLSRNFGHQAAVSAGLAHIRGRAVMIMDADLQDPPELLPSFIERWREGYDVVYAVRRKRKENVLKRLGYYWFYRVLASNASISIPLDSGDFCLMDRRVVDFLDMLPERARFVRGLRAWVGLKQIGVEYERDLRHAGVTKYTLGKLYQLAADGIVSFSSTPLRLATKLGFLIATLSFMTAIIYLMLRLFADYDWPPGFASLFIGMCFLFGLQFILIGVLGEYVASIQNEVKGRPTFLVDKLYGFNEEKLPNATRNDERSAENIESSLSSR